MSIFYTSVLIATNLKTKNITTVAPTLLLSNAATWLPTTDDAGILILIHVSQRHLTS